MKEVNRRGRRNENQKQSKTKGKRDKGFFEDAGDRIQYESDQGNQGTEEESWEGTLKTI
jgi:hypothetical protein